MQDGNKGALQSSGIVGSLTAIVMGVATIAGMQLDVNEVTTFFTAAATIVSSAVAMYGRYTADKKIKGLW